MANVRIRFNAAPPAKLIVGDVVIPAGGEGEIPEEEAKRLAKADWVDVTVDPKKASPDGASSKKEND